MEFCFTGDGWIGGVGFNRMFISYFQFSAINSFSNYAQKEENFITMRNGNLRLVSHPNYLLFFYLKCWSLEQYALKK